MADSSGNERAGWRGIGKRPAPWGKLISWALRQLPLRAAAFPGRSAPLLLVPALAMLGACPGEAPPTAWPAGTVLAVDDVPITAAEIAADMVPVILIEPQWNEVQHKRLAFNELALPRAIQRAAAPARDREEARRKLDLDFARITQGSLVGPPTSSGAVGEEVVGHWQQLGLGVWGEAMNLAPGQWSEVIECPGSFLRLRVLERTDGPVPAATHFRLDTISCPFGDPSSSRVPNDERLKAHRLTIVDPSWETIVPERTKYLMGIRSP